MTALLAVAPELEGPHGRVPSPFPLTLDEALFLPPFWACWFGLLLSLFGGVALLRARYRSGSPVERRQILWLAYGALLMPLWLAGGSLWSRLVTPLNAVVDGVAIVFFQVWPAVAVAVAVTRHGLYSIDRLFNRTLVYAVLTALLVATYAVVALASGLLAGGSALSASLATLAAALAFRPLRDRIQDLVDRRFARARFDAVRLVRGFLDDVREGRAEPEDIGAVLGVALADPAAEVVFRLPETGGYADRRGRVLDGLPDDGRARAVIGRDDRELGLLLHTPAPACGPDVLRAALDAAAVPVELARLRVELRLQLAEVSSSRARIAHAGYEERRRIERDLHDGAQQRLVTLGIVLRRMQRSLPREARLLGPSFDAAVDEVAAAIVDLRTIAAGVRPPRLDEGLSAALEDLARGAGVPVDVVASPDRAPPDVEAAAYFVACEALTNAVKHASPSRVEVRAAREDGALTLVVADDGVGGASLSSGTGLPGMRDRVAAHGGTLTVDSPPGAGTRLAVRSRAGRDRRGHGPPAGGPRRPARGRRPRGRRARRRRRGPARARRRARTRSWPSSTCGCRRTTTTRARARPRSSAGRTRAPRSSSSPSTSRRATSSSWSPPAAASATCSRTACSRSTTSSTPRAASATAARRSIRRSSRRSSGCRAR